MADAEDQRLGVVAAKSSYAFPGDLTLTGVWMPRIKSNVAPFARPPGLMFIENTDNTSQFAVKLDRSAGDFDWSISYLDGANLNPELELSSGFYAPAILMRHQRAKIFGADAATVIGRYGLRAEAAYTWIEKNDNQADIHLSKSFFNIVLGGDRTFDNGSNVNLQYFLYCIEGYIDPRNIKKPLTRAIGIESAVATHQLEVVTHGGSFRMGNKWLDDTLEAEITGILFFRNSDYALKPRITYAINDHFKALAGVDIFRGKKDTFFGRIKDASTAFVQMRYSF